MKVLWHYSGLTITNKYCFGIPTNLVILSLYMRWPWACCAQPSAHPPHVPSSGSPVSLLATWPHHNVVKYRVRSPKFVRAPCAVVHSLAETPQPQPSFSPQLGSYTRALLVSQDWRHLYVTPWLELKLQEIIQWSFLEKSIADVFVKCCIVDPDPHRSSSFW